MKYLSENAVQYMRGIWGFGTSDEVDDMAMFWSHGEYELVALRLVEGGAVEANCPEAKEMIRVAKSVTRKEQDDIIEACLKDHTILVCSACNYTHFVPHGWCDVNDWIEGGCQNCRRKNTCEVQK